MEKNYEKDDKLNNNIGLNVNIEFINDKSSNKLNISPDF